MSNNTTAPRDIGSISCTLVLMLIAGLFYYDTTTMVDSDSFVFPRAIILMLLLIGLIRLIQDVIAPLEIVRDLIHQKYIRSFLLIVSMAIAISLIPLIGFFLSLMIAFFAIMVLSMHEQWTVKKFTSYSAIAAAVVASLYLLFKNLFSVQFPEGILL